MRAVGVDDPAACVFVGDRPFDDIHGAKEVGMRAVLVPHSAIPDLQKGAFAGEPDATIQRLSDLPPDRRRLARRRAQEAARGWAARGARRGARRRGALWRDLGKGSARRPT